MSIFRVKLGKGFVLPAERKEVQEKKCENIEDLSVYYTEKANKVFEQYSNGVEPLVDIDCKLNIEYFSEENNGPYGRNEITDDGDLKDDLYNKWAVKKYNLTEDTDSGYIIEKVAEYKRRRENNRGE